MTIGEAMSVFGLIPHDLPALKRNRRDILGYIETHIEQGSALQHNAAPIGIVTVIRGIERWRVTICGRAAHTGATPMDLRHDTSAMATCQGSRCFSLAAGMASATTPMNLQPLQFQKQRHATCTSF